ncbi:hypothetical protein RQP46_010630 [Phenoliferia psychrophenolica]
MNGSHSVPSFQDIDSGSDSSDEDEDSPEWRAAQLAARESYTESERREMMEYLKERGLFAFVTRYIDRERIPIPKLLLAFGVLLPPVNLSLGDQLRLLKMACSKVLRNREKLEQYNTVDDVVALIAKSKKIMVLTGAGVSTSCGIPDFRSPTGLYARLKEEHWELEDPQQMFDLPYFKEKPDVFYSFAKEIYPSNFIPSPCHRFVRLLELNEKLLRNYTQNIDGLFERVGLSLVLNCHGSFATASCLLCRTRFPGEMLSDEFDRRLLEDREEVDLLIVIGTSLRVSPVAQIVSHLPHSVPQILINRDPISHAEFDVHLLGDGDTIVKYLCDRLAASASPLPPRSSGWDLDERVPSLAPPPLPSTTTTTEAVKEEEVVPERVSSSHVWLFPGANGGRWVEAVREYFEEGSEEEDDAEGGEKGSGLEVPSGGESRSRTRSPEDEQQRGEWGKKARVD